MIKDRSLNRKIKSVEEQRGAASLEISLDQENFISTMICAAELKGPGGGGAKGGSSRYSLLAIITFWSQSVIKSAIRTSGLPAIKTTMDRHFVREARKKVTPSNEPKRNSDERNCQRAGERTSGSKMEKDRKGFDLLPQ